MTTENAPQDQNKAPRSDEPSYIRIVEPWPLLGGVTDDECWESLTKGDLKILGVEDREHWERKFDGNPCKDPRLKNP